MNKELSQSFSTFLTNTGSPEEQLRRATDVSTMDSLTRLMEARSGSMNADLLVPTACNQSCPGCFYDLPETLNIPDLDDDSVKDLRQTIDLLRTKDNNPTFYPREPSVSRRILDVYKELSVTRAITNGKLLYKPEKIAAFKASGITDIVVTVPGLQSSYGIYTGEDPATYDRLMTGISKAVQEGLNVSVFTPVFEKNINDIEEMTDRLTSIGIKDIKFIRVIPTGRARFLPDDFFLTKDGMMQFMTNVDKTRKKWGEKMSLSLFGLTFGPNFFGMNVWQKLAGGRPGWPESSYLCPTINRQYLGVVLGSKDVFTCFQAMSFPDQRLGYIENGTIVFSPEKPARTPNKLIQNLRGNCAADACEYQPICLGACRTAALSEATRRNEPDPEYAGQTICVTNILKELMD